MCIEKKFSSSDSAALKFRFEKISKALTAVTQEVLLDVSVASDLLPVIKILGDRQLHLMDSMNRILDESR